MPSDPAHDRLIQVEFKPEKLVVNGEAVKLKWFKHYSDALDDPFIQDLMDRFSHMGYAVWFGLIEIIAKENKNSITGKLSISPTYLRRKLRTSPAKLREVFDYCQTSGKLLVNFSENNWDFNFTKIAEIKDNYTKDLQASGKKVSIEEEVEKEKEEEVEKTKTNAAPENSFSEKKEKPKTSTGSQTQESAFTELKSSYPKKNGKFFEEQEVFRRFCLVPEDDWPLLIQAVKNYANSERVKDGIGIKDPKNFIGNQMNESSYWKEWIEPEKTEDESDGEERTDELRRILENVKGA